VFKFFRKPEISKPVNWPELAIHWPDSWWYLPAEADLQQGLQTELIAELSDKHPLWGLQALVVAKSNLNDDIIVALNNDRFALVHLLWHGHVDQQAAAFPATQILAGAAQLQELLLSLDN